MHAHTGEESEKAAICNPGRKFIPETIPDDTLMLDFQPQEMWENTFLLLKPSRLWYSAMAPTQINKNVCLIPVSLCHYYNCFVVGFEIKIYKLSLFMIFQVCFDILSSLQFHIKFRVSHQCQQSQLGFQWKLCWICRSDGLYCHFNNIKFYYPWPWYVFPLI